MMFDQRSGSANCTLLLGVFSWDLGRAKVYGHALSGAQQARNTLRISIEQIETMGCKSTWFPTVSQVLTFLPEHLLD